MKNKKELKEILNFSIKLANKTGKTLLKFEKKINQLQIKNKNTQGVCSSADLAAEKIIMNAIKFKFSQDLILAEESYFEATKGKRDAQKHLEKFQQAKSCWIIDPLDGTNNFLNGFNYYSVCIAYVEYGIPKVGVVYRPSTGDCFYAIKGQGAFKKNLLRSSGRIKKLAKFENKKKLCDAILITGFAGKYCSTLEDEFQLFRNLLMKTRAVRRLGGAALDICYVAEGIFDGFWERGLAPWDVAASGLICQESGVNITDFNGRDFSPFDITVLASRKPLYSKVKRVFKS